MNRFVCVRKLSLERKTKKKNAEQIIDRNKLSEGINVCKSDAMLIFHFELRIKEICVIRRWLKNFNFVWVKKKDHLKPIYAEMNLSVFYVFK